jgi:alpha-mannosidase
MMHSWVDASDGATGFAVLTKGVPQYEVQRDQDDSLVFVLTLMRAAIGHTHTHDPDLTVGGQCSGEQAAEYAVFPHGGDWLSGEVPREAAGYTCPPRMVRTSRHEGSEPPSGAWLGELPPEIMLTATKRSEDGTALILRLVNLLRRERHATLVLRNPPRAAWRANLREEPEDELAVSPDGSVRLRFGPMEIVTLRLDWQR